MRVVEYDRTYSSSATTLVYMDLTPTRVQAAMARAAFPGTCCFNKEAWLVFIFYWELIYASRTSASTALRKNILSTAHTLWK